MLPQIFAYVYSISLEVFFECLGQIDFLSLPFVVSLMITANLYSLALRTYCPVSASPLCLGAEASVVVDYKLKPIFVAVVAYAFELIEKHFCLLDIFVMCIKQIHKTCNRVYFTGIPRGNIKQNTALFTESLKTFEFACQLICSQQTTGFGDRLFLIYQIV